MLERMAREPSTSMTEALANGGHWALSDSIRFADVGQRDKRRREGTMANAAFRGYGW